MLSRGVIRMSRRASYTDERGKPRLNYLDPNTKVPISNILAAERLGRCQVFEPVNVAEGWLYGLVRQQGSKKRQVQISHAYVVREEGEAARALSHLFVTGCGSVAVILLVIYGPSYSGRSSAVCRSAQKYQTGGLVV